MTGNILGRREFIDCMAAIGVAACYPPIRAVAAATRAAGAFTFAQWNIGHFAMGRASDTKIRPDESAARLAQYRKLVDRIDADFIGINEYSAKFDLAGTDARSAVFGKYKDFRAGPHLGYKCNAVASRTAPLKSMRIGEFSRRMRRAYYMVCESEIDGTPFVLAETHLDLASKEMRASQIGELVRDLAGCPRVILAGDFNIDDEGEYAPLVEAGFKMANFGAFGTFKTHRRGNAKATPCIDNIFARGFDMLDAWTDDDKLELSDHRMLLCRLGIPGGRGGTLTERTRLP